MFLPVGDSPNPRGFTPFVNYALIAVNVAIFLVLLPLSFQQPSPGDPARGEYLRAIYEERQLTREQAIAVDRSLSRYDLLVFERGFRPGEPHALDVLSSMFLHGGWAHLLGNMLFLWIFGDNLEYRLGRGTYLTFYLLTGVLACSGDAVLRWGSQIPSVGASGAISGVLGGYFIWFPHNRVRLFVVLFPFVQELQIAARWVLGGYLVVQNILPALFAGSGGGVSYGAHVGGFIAGAAGAFVLDRVVLERPEGDVLRMEPTAAGPTPVPERVGAALREGRVEEAAATFFQLPHALTRRAVSAADKLLLGTSLERAGQPHAAMAAFERVIRDHPGRPEVSPAHLAAARLLLDVFDQPTLAYQHLHAAVQAARTPEDLVAARQHLAHAASLFDSMPRR